MKAQSNFNILKALVLVAFLLGTFVYFSSCKKDKDEKPVQAPPQLPPEASFIMNFNNLSDTTHTKAVITYASLNDTTHTYKNWGYSAVNVWVWNTILFVNLAIPVASFRESFNHEPVLISSNPYQWVWSYSVPNSQYSANLYGTLTNAGVNWKMYISHSTLFTDFLWYEGDHDVDRTAGTWTLYKSPNENIKFIGISWHRDAAGTTGDIKYTHIEPNVPNNGGFIYYGYNTDTGYNGFYNISNVAESKYTEIQVNLTNNNGRVKDSVYFLDNEWHCWSEQLYDISCQP